MHAYTDIVRYLDLCIPGCAQSFGSRRTSPAYVDRHAYNYVCVRVCACVCVCGCVCVCLHVHISVCLRVYLCVRTYLEIDAYIYVYIYICTCRAAVDHAARGGDHAHPQRRARPPAQHDAARTPCALIPRSRTLIPQSRALIPQSRTLIPPFRTLIPQSRTLIPQSRTHIRPPARHGGALRAPYSGTPSHYSE